MINLTDLDTLNYPGSNPHVTLSRLTILRAQQSQPYPNPSLSVLEDFNSGVPLSGVPPFYVYSDGNSTPVSVLPVNVTRNVSLMFTPGFFYQMGNNNNYQLDTSTQLYIQLTFQLDSPNWYLNNTVSGPFDYNYNPAYVTQPVLRGGVMEIAVW